MLRRRPTLAAVAALAVGGALLPASTAVASARGSWAGSDGSGYSVETSFTRSAGGSSGGGGGRGGGGGSRTASAAATASCWWTPVPGAPADDAAAMVGWFEDRAEVLVGPLEVARPMLGTPQEWAAAAEQEASGQDVTWYHAQCRGGAAGDAGSGVPGAQAQVDGGEHLQRLAEYTGRTYEAGEAGTLPVTYGAYPAGRPPQALVDARTLVELARGELDLPAPEVERNPRSQGLGATFVGLPTWFWVVDPESVGGISGTRTIRAQAGSSWAEVTVETAGITVSSPAGATTCDPQQATTPWSPGAQDESGCTLAFTRSSAGFPGGLPVEVSTRWTATWRSSDGAGGPLPGLVRTAQDTVPVMESQTLVRGLP
ncbi:hypothetical protein [Pseudokineococcus sp. 1T1Z-3]|uniref:hypothetical protein n=1 Tax=Pseudokineococcus sp. 1T1Z-3 TaxID=3132745 RepID=UPI0030975E65